MNKTLMCRSCGYRNGTHHKNCNDYLALNSHGTKPSKTDKPNLDAGSMRLASFENPKGQTHDTFKSLIERLKLHTFVINYEVGYKVGVKHSEEIVKQAIEKLETEYNQTQTSLIGLGNVNFFVKELKKELGIE